MTVYSGGGRQPTAATPIDLRRCCCWPRRTKKGANKRIFKKNEQIEEGRNKMFLQQFNQRLVHKVTKKKEAEAKDLLRKCWETLSSRVVGGPTHKKKRKKGKPCTLFNQANSFCALCTTGVVTADTKAVAARVKRLVLTTR